MDKKTILAVIISAALTAIVGLIIANVVGVFERGSDALTEDQIKSVLEETMKADFNGETLSYGQALSKIDSRLTSMEAALNVLVE